MTRIGHHDLAGALHSERELADGDVLLVGNVGSTVHLARIAPTGSKRWEKSFDAGAGRLPESIRVFEHAGGIGFVGRVRDAGQGCVLHGSAASDGSGLQWSCDLPDAGVGELRAHRFLPGGLELVFFSVANGQPRLLVVTKQGSGSLASKVLTWSEPAYWFPAAVGVGEGGVVAALEGGTELPRSRLLRWTSGPAPAVDALLAGQERLHRALFAVELPGGDVLAGAAQHIDFHIVRTTAKGDALWHLTRPDIVVGDSVARGASDGSVRVLARLIGNVGRVYAIDAAGSIAWQASLADIGGSGSVEVDDSGRTLVGHADQSGSGCHFQRFDAAGAPDGALNITGAGSSARSIRLGDGRSVWNCGGLRIIDSLFATVDVTAACPMQAAQLKALDGNRWVAVGASGADTRTMRVCLFDSAQFLRSADVPAPELPYGQSLRAVNVDAARNVWLALVQEPPLRNVKQLIHARFVPETGELQTWPDRGVREYESLLAVAAPDERNRIAILLGSDHDGRLRRVSSGLPGDVPDWTSPLPMPEFAQPLLLRTGSALLAAHAPAGVMDGVVFRVAPVRGDVIFAEDFESLAR